MNKASVENLELGNILFHNNTIQSCNCPAYIIALLSDLGDRIEDITGVNPFQNTAAEFKTETFEVEAYNWDEDREQPYNFKYKYIEISWYKRLGRDTTINGVYLPSQIVRMYNDCLEAIRKVENETKEEEDEDVSF